MVNNLEHPRSKDEPELARGINIFNALFRDFRPKRKKPTIQERLTPCRWCNFPLSQKHHVFPIERYGESNDTVQICANCHEIFHVCFDAIVKKSKTARVKFAHLVECLGEENEPLARASQIAAALAEHEITKVQKNGG